ncbi:MAG: translation initiation factor IF-3 [Deltaproteobacteria bacterium]|nr:MAG: translation initiation factor IF-3 [Deltaproteobacteria bacterium]RLB02114.1 MAG: translation initiation factor IF-3 [Deltaproteobacteria bacterium]
MEKRLRVNRAIRARTVRVVDPEGKQLGIMSLREALAKAEEFGLDLVEVAPNADPPVCKIMDYGKFKYLQSKRAQEAKKKQQASSQIKEIKMRPRTEEHDLQIKLKKIEEFLKSGHKTKVRIVFRGRELAHKEAGERMMQRILEETKEWGKPDYQPKFEGRQMVVMLSPRSSGG